MPIEIRELIIKTTVEKKSLRSEPAAVDKSELKQDILNACKKMMKQIIKENKQR